MTVRFGTEEFRDAVDLSHREFYERLIESDVLPASSQITPVTFDRVFSEITANGDVAICITVSSKLSGTYQSACFAAGSYPGRVFVVDSENGLNLRAAPYTGSQVVYVLPYGMVLNVLGEGENGFLHVQWANYTGYVSREYVTPFGAQ